MHRQTAMTSDPLPYHESMVYHKVVSSDGTKNHRSKSIPYDSGEIFFVFLDNEMFFRRPFFLGV